MARLLTHLTRVQGTTVGLPQAGLAAASLLLCAFALFMCASHAQKFRRSWRACHNFVGEIFDDEPVIQHYNETGINGFQHCDEGIREGDENQSMSMVSCEQPVWKKNILMGGKCQLPDFSGLIIYDSDGNIVSSGKPPRALLTWK